MEKRWSRFKPGGQRRTHLLLAAGLWTAIGIILLVRSWQSLSPSLLVYMLAALLLGTVKSLVLLDAIAAKTVHRISRLDDGACLGAVYSIKTWLLVGVMVLSGMILRRLALPHELLGLVYGTVGWALIFSSRHAWRAWRRWGTTAGTA